MMIQSDDSIHTLDQSEVSIKIPHLLHAPQHLLLNLGVLQGNHLHKTTNQNTVLSQSQYSMDSSPMTAPLAALHKVLGRLLHGGHQHDGALGLALLHLRGLGADQGGHL